MSKVALITGGGSGLGREMAKKLSEEDIVVYIIGRRSEKLHETVRLSSGKVIPIIADVSTDKGRKTIHQNLKEQPISYLIHNAGIANPLKSLLEVRVDEWKQIYATNVEAPLFLTQLLINNFRKGSRIIHISSGLAHRSMPGVGAYCSSKAALYSIYETFKLELSEIGILMGSVRPGAVETEMQETLRDPSLKSKFLSHDFFIGIKEQGVLISAQESSDKIINILLNSSDRQFIAEEWGVGEGKLREFIQEDSHTN